MKRNPTLKKLLACILLTILIVATGCGSSPKNPEAANHPIPEDVDISFQKTMRNDETGKCRLARVATFTDVTDYIIPYYYNYFESDDEVHIIVNFSTKTTSIVRKMANILDVTVHEYVDKEEHDAKSIGSGIVYAEYFVYLDTGEIEEIEPEAP